MKDINRLIRHYVLEIMLTVFIVAISIPVWDKLNKSDAAKVASSYATMDYINLKVDKYIGNDEFKDVIALTNNTNTLRGYTVVVKINKKNTKDNIIMSIDNAEYMINNLKYTEDKDYVYYELKNGQLVADTKSYEIEYLNSDITYSDIEYNIIENHNM